MSEEAVAVDLGPNRHLIGVRGARRMFSTPALLLDLDLFERNLAAMAGRCRAAGCALRPHVKGPKSVPVARAQLAAGASGLACATLAEAEVMAGAGLGPILITSPVASPPMIARLVALNARSPGLLATVDHPRVAEALDAAAAAAGQPLAVLVDVDVGQKRTGSASEDDALALARQVEDAPHLAWRGVQAYYGNLQGIRSYAERKARASGQIGRIQALRRRLEGAGLKPSVISGGGTGTCAIDLEARVFTELQPGSYPFMDAQYAAVEIEPEAPHPFAVALFVQAGVVSANQPGKVTINAGMKAIPTDGGPIWFTRGAGAGCAYAAGGDEFGFVLYPDAEDAYLSPGDVVECVTPHCDTATNLHHVVHCVRGEVLVDIWPVAARGRW